MIEILDNGIQLLVTGLCMLLVLRRCLRTGQRPWILLALFYGCFFLADLYWFLFLVYIGDTPGFSYVSDMTYYASFLFLILLVRSLFEEAGPRIRTPLAVTGPLFAAGMAVFFMRWGDYLSNLLCGLFMGFLSYYTIRELILLSASANKGDAGARALRRFLFHILLIFVTEYVLWTLSCFWMGDGLENPYFWVDALLTAEYGLLVPALGKAVRDR